MYDEAKPDETAPSELHTQIQGRIYPYQPVKIISACCDKYINGEVVMGLGRNEGHQGKLYVTWDDLPCSPGHVFHCAA